MTKTKAIHVAIKSSRSHLRGDGRHADVERVLQTTGHILHAPRFLIPVLDGCAAHKDGAGIQIGCAGRDCAAIQRGSHGEDLGHRTRFIGHGDGRVEFTGIVVDRAVIPELIQIHARGDCHGKQFAVARIHDNDRAAIRSVGSRALHPVFARRRLAGHG